MLPLPGPLLAFDTSAAHCAAVFIRADGRLGARRFEAMAKGQAERLMPLLEEVLAEAGAGWRDLAGLAVGIGPGNFTGVRISVAAARGLALALRCPVLGISGFERLLDPLAPETEGPLLLTLPAPRGQLYVQGFEGGRALGPPGLVDPADPGGLADLAVPTAARLRGEGAEVLAAVLGLSAEPLPAVERLGEKLGADPGVDLLDRLAARAVWAFGQSLPASRPAPLYVRPADAAPPSDPPPVILDV